MRTLILLGCLILFVFILAKFVPHNLSFGNNTFGSQIIPKP